LDRKAENLFAVHVNVGSSAGVDAGDHQDLPVAAAAHDGAQRGIILSPLHHGGAGTVAEQHAGAAVGEIGDPAEHFAADHQGVLAGAGGQQALGGVQAVDKAGAGGVQVKADGVLGHPQLLLQHAGGGGGHGVLGQGRHQADADLFGADAGALQSPAGGGGAQAQVIFLSGAVVPAGNAGAGDDPLVAGVHLFLQVEVG